MGVLVAVLEFLGGPIGRWVLIIGVAVASVLGLKHHWKQEGWDEREEVAEKEQAARDKAESDAFIAYQKRLEDYSRDLDAKLAAANARIASLQQQQRALNEKLKEKGDAYVPPASDERIARCGGIPLGFVVFHDAAARGGAALAALPATPDGREVDRDSGVALSQVRDVVRENYDKFHRCMISLKAWEEWYPTARQSYETFGRTPAPSSPAASP